ncbi:MAG TPA: cyclodeaminase/cyclohydrolase family protein, partial [Spirochaetia bacterium]|nr:cyclodeaminase/cyclohydrolase family protein [Spirochaetia bacterium]
PGGGSVAALAGSLGAALAVMVANLTVGKKGYEPSWASLSELAVRAQGVKAALLRAVDEDTAAFNLIMEAMKLPKGGEAEKAAREAALQEGYKKASLVPLETARACLEAISLCALAAASGNASSVTDAGVGALMARAGAEGAVLNVLVNLGSVKDAAFAAELGARARALLEEADRRRDEAIGFVRKAIKSD